MLGGQLALGSVANAMLLHLGGYASGRIFDIHVCLLEAEAARRGWPEAVAAAVHYLLETLSRPLTVSAAGVGETVRYLGNVSPVRVLGDSANHPPRAGAG